MDKFRKIMLKDFSHSVVPNKDMVGFLTLGQSNDSDSKSIILNFIKDRFKDKFDCSLSFMDRLVISKWISEREFQNWHTPGGY